MLKTWARVDPSLESVHQPPASVYSQRSQSDVLVENVFSLSAALNQMASILIWQKPQRFDFNCCSSSPFIGRISLLSPTFRVCTLDLWADLFLIRGASPHYTDPVLKHKPGCGHDEIFLRSDHIW